MLKKPLHYLLVLLFCSSLVLAQTITVTTHGISPRDVLDSADDIFDLAYNGLENVGIGTKIYLKGTADDVTGGTWSVVSTPSGSAAGFDTPENSGTTIQYVSFVPDVVGTYVLQFTVGADNAQITINAGTYLGYESGTIACSVCHAETVEKWKATGHSNIFSRAMEGTLSSHYGPTCLSCHTTGNDPNADNTGFDDRDFVYPDSLNENTWNNLLTTSPEAMKLANIQCESCHGPGSEHMGKTSNNEIAASLSTDNCAWCHDSGTHHVYPEQWDVSVHANLAHPYTRASCVPCHNGQGFVEFVKNGKVALSEDLAANVNITCATCHDPHDATNTHQLRTVDVSLENGTVVGKGGLGKLCMNCHKSRRDAVTYTDDYLNNLSSHYGPHHGPQADILLGENFPTFGQTIVSSNHAGALENACVTCHMAPGHADSEGNIILSGSHSFRMSSPEGVDNIAVCSSCHSDMTTDFAAVSFSYNGTKDIDGDGTAEGLQIEVQGMLDAIAMLLPPLNSTDINTIDSTWTLAQAQAYYNYDGVLEDKSFGIHNPSFVIGLLKASIAELEGTTITEPGKFYLGNNAANCAPCHTDANIAGDQVTNWENTKHAIAQTGAGVSFLRYECLECHTTGWVADEDNYGADEYVTEDASATFGWSMTDAEGFAAKTDIQCETCHGPMGQADGSIALSGHQNSGRVTIASENCGVCHTGDHHPTYDKWSQSKHAVLESGQTRSSCAPCHNGQGFVDYIKVDKTNPTSNYAEVDKITCATCHDPHNSTNTHQLRTVEVTLTDGTVIEEGGLGKLCMNCHKTRRDGVAYTDDYLNNISSHYGPHHGPQADLLAGKNMPTFGLEFTMTNHIKAVEDACVTCHMGTGDHSDENGTPIMVGGHSFSMSSPEGADNMDACTGCHGGFGESFESIEVAVRGNFDLDGDGTNEGLQVEVEGMLETIAMKLPPLGSTDIEMDSSWTVVQAKAYYNYDAVLEDGSRGIHNPKFIVRLLEESIAQLDGKTTGVDEIDGLPTVYELSQNYPNPFNPTTQIKFSVPEAGNVKITIFDVIGKQVEVLVDQNMNAGNFTTTWNAGRYASGVYFYRMQSNNFVSVKKMVLIK